MKFQAKEPQVKISGRTLYRDGTRFLGYSGSSVTFCFYGRKAAAHLISNPSRHESFQHAWVAVYINGDKEPSKRFSLEEDEADYVLYEGEADTELTITICKYSEPEYAACGIAWIETDSESLLPPPMPKNRRIQIIGDSITCGYGVEGSLEDTVLETAKENPAKAYSLLTARALDAEAEIVAWNGKGMITQYVGEEVNTPVNDWLVPMLYEYTDAGCERDYFHRKKEDWEFWNHDSYIPDLVIVYLGTNDASYTRGILERNREFEAAYTAFLERIHQNHPAAKILCTLGTMDRRLCGSVEAAVNAFLLLHPKGNAFYLELPMQDEADGLGTFWHPTAVTHQKAAALIINKAKEIMNW